MKRIFLGVVFMVSLLALFPAGVRAGEMGILIDKLVNKGVLTRSEADGVLEETKKQVKADIDKGKSSLSPSWAQNVKFTGDFRLRYEGTDTKPADSGKRETRNRGRFRFRYGFTAKVNEKIDVGFRMASGSADPISGNQTFSGTFSSKGIWIDRAFVEYKPNDNVALIGGKFANPYWEVGDLVWASDIMPEGAAIKLTMPIESTKLFATLGLLPMYETDSNYDNPLILGGQFGIDTKISDIGLKGAIAYYDFFHLKDKAEATISPSYKPGTNTLAGGSYVYDYQVFNVSGEIVPISIDFLGQNMPIRLFGNYILNAASDVPNENDTGFLAGISLGRARKIGEWDIAYTYYAIQKDAIPAIVNSSDFETNHRGHKVGLAYQLAKNTTLGVNYYTMERITGANRDHQKWQTQIQFKF